MSRDVILFKEFTRVTDKVYFPNSEPTDITYDQGILGNIQDGEVRKINGMNPEVPYEEGDNLREVVSFLPTDIEVDTILTGVINREMAELIEPIEGEELVLVVEAKIVGDTKMKSKVKYKDIRVYERSELDYMKNKFDSTIAIDRVSPM